MAVEPALLRYDAVQNSVPALQLTAEYQDELAPGCSICSHTCRLAGGGSMPRLPPMEGRGTRMCSCIWMSTLAQISCGAATNGEGDDRC